MLVVGKKTRNGGAGENKPRSARKIFSDGVSEKGFDKSIQSVLRKTR